MAHGQRCSAISSSNPQCRLARWSASGSGRARPPSRSTRVSVPRRFRRGSRKRPRLGAHVAGHLGVGTSCAEAAELGIDTIERSFSSCPMDLPDEWRDDPGAMDPRAPEVVALIGTLVEHGVVLVTTPWVGFPTEEELSMLSPNRLALREEGGGPPPGVRRRLDQVGTVHREMERAFVTAGGTLLIGADAMNGGHVPGYNNHQSMIALAEAFSPLEIVKMATSGTSRTSSRTAVHSTRRSRGRHRRDSSASPEAGPRCPRRSRGRSPGQAPGTSLPS